MNKITILGSGTSTGVPILGCKCNVCQSDDSRNKRLRTSALITTVLGNSILVDASPDLRTQLLKHKVQRIDAAIITHDHADHIHGIDDLRPFTFIQKNPIPIYVNEELIESLKSKFPYIFDRHNYFENKSILGGGIPLLDLKPITKGHYKIQQESFELYLLPHGHDSTLGLSHRKMAYLVDCRELPEEVIKSLQSKKLDLLIIDCLRYSPHQTHLNLDQVITYTQAIKPVLTVLTHMGHELDYLDLLTQLERRKVKNVIPAIDGQTFLYS